MFVRTNIFAITLMVLIPLPLAFASATNYAIRLDGKEDYLEIFDNPALHFSNQMTIEVWVKLLNSSGGVLFNKWTENVEDKQLVFASDRRVTFHLHGPEGSGQSRYSHTKLTVGQWYHLVGTTDGNLLYIYVNGALDTSWTGSGQSIGNGTNPARIGSEFFRSIWNLPIYGEVDELRIWNTYRTASQVREMMSKEAAGNEPGLVACYHFNEASGQIAHDATSNHNDAIFGNSSANDYQDPKWVVSSAPLREPLPYLQLPIQDYHPITFGWGLRRKSTTCSNCLHVAEDVGGGKAGTPVYAIADGQVKLAETHKSVCDGNWGPLVVIEHRLPDNSKICGIYAHIAFSVAVGQSVTRGQQIGVIANLSCTTRWVNHLHFGIFKGAYNQSVNPYIWVKGYLAANVFPGNFVKPSEFITGYNKKHAGFVLSCKANMTVLTPSGDTISSDYITVGNAQYISWPNIYSEDTLDMIDEIEIEEPDSGTYIAIVKPDTNATDTSSFSLYAYGDSSAGSIVEDMLISNAPPSGYSKSLGCCLGNSGNIDCDLDGGVDISDLSALIDNLYISFTPLCCAGGANIDGQSGIDISDLSALIDYLYISFTPPAACQ